MTAKKTGDTGKWIALIVISLFVSVAGLELGLRGMKAAGLFPGFFQSLGIPNPPIDRRDGPGMYYVHPYSAYNIKPGFTYGAGEKINSLGFRGEEISFEKPPNTYRIVAIGGSTTFGVYVNWDESYPYFLQRDLNERLKTTHVEVINAGIVGANSAESLHRLFYQILPLKPDMVIYYEGYNDLLPRFFNDFQKDYYHFRRSSTYYPEGLTRFELYRLVLKALSPITFNNLFNLTNMVWKKDNYPFSDEQRLKNFLATDASVYEQNLDYVVSTLIANGVQPVLSTFPIKPDIVHWNDDLPGFAWELGVRQNNEAITRVAEKFKVPLIPFAEVAKDLPATNLWNMLEGCCYTDSIHMSAEGDVIQASIFADTVEPIVRQSFEAKQSAL